MKLFCILFFVVFTFHAHSAYALTNETNRDVLSYLPDFVKTPEGGVSWDFFTTTKEITESGKDGQGMDYEIMVPGFSKEMKALDGQTIVMQGYMFPLEAEEKQGLFLFGPFPLSCPYHYHVGPAMVIEVHAKVPIVFSYDPVNIRGRLELIPKDIETETFYRLHDAVEIM